MKKYVCFLLIAVIGFSAAFGASRQETPRSQRLICGVTEFEPMNFRDARGNWTGFDTEFALLVGEKLGMQVEFQMIAWAQKFTELNSGAIDAIWNGFTATANEPDGTPRITLCDMSYSYMLNTQCIVVRANRANEFRNEASFAGRTLAAESGSAGETKAKGIVGENGRTVGVMQQINTFLEVMTGAADGAVIDVILARQLVGSGDFASLAIAFELGPEVYAIGFRTGDPLRDRVNQAMVELYQEGRLLQIARKYGLEERLVLDRTFGRR